MTDRPDHDHADLEVIPKLGRADDKASNHHVITSVDKTAGADISQLRISRLMKVVGFEQTNSCAVILAA